MTDPLYYGQINYFGDKYQLLQALRIELASELDAIMEYSAHVEIAKDTLFESEDEWIIPVLEDILKEEKLHAEQLQYCIERLQKSGKEIRDEAVNEVQTSIKNFYMKEESNA